MHRVVVSLVSAQVEVAHATLTVSSSNQRLVTVLVWVAELHHLLAVRALGRATRTEKRKNGTGTDRMLMPTWPTSFHFELTRAPL